MKHDPVFEAIADLSKLATDLMPLTAIWLEKPLQMGGKRSLRITKGDVVRVEYGVLVDCWRSEFLFGIHNNPTHEITECRGNLYNTMFEVDLRDLKTNELLTIKL